MRQADLSDAIGEHINQLTNSLKQLDDFGIIEYTAVKQKPFVAYKLTVPVASVNYRNRGITKKLIQVMDEHRDNWLSLEDIADELMKDDPSYADQSQEQHVNLRHRISANLSTWKDRNLAAARDFQGRDRSKIALTDAQRALLVEFLEIIDRFQTQDPDALAEGRNLAFHLTPAEKAELMAKAKANSPSANSSPYEEMESVLFGFIEGHPGISGNELREILRGNGKRLTKGGLHGILNRMKREGLIISNTITGNTNHWTTVPSDHPNRQTG